MEVLYFLTKELLIESVEPNIILPEKMDKNTENIDPVNLDEVADEDADEVALEDHEITTEDHEVISENNEVITSAKIEVMNHEDHSILNNK